MPLLFTVVAGFELFSAAQISSRRQDLSVVIEPQDLTPSSLKSFESASKELQADLYLMADWVVLMKLMFSFVMIGVLASNDPLVRSFAGIALTASISLYFLTMGPSVEKVAAMGEIPSELPVFMVKYMSTLVGLTFLAAVLEIKATIGSKKRKAKVD